MCKNQRIEARVDQRTKEALDRKAKAYGGITKFLEVIATKDILVMDKATTQLITKLYGKTAVSCL